MPPVQRDDPYGAYNFLVEVIGIAPNGHDVTASFTEVTGLTVDIQPIEYRDGNAKKPHVTKQQGLAKMSNLVLKRGITGHPEFWNWVKLSMNGRTERAEGAITLLDENRSAAARVESGSRASVGRWASRSRSPGVRGSSRGRCPEHWPGVRTAGSSVRASGLPSATASSRSATKRRSGCGADRWSRAPVRRPGPVVPASVPVRR